VGNQGTYGRWVGVQTRLSCVCNSLSSFPINNLSVYSRLSTFWSLISICCPNQWYGFKLLQRGAARSRYRLGLSIRHNAAVDNHRGCSQVLWLGLLSRHVGLRRLRCPGSNRAMHVGSACKLVIRSCHVVVQYVTHRTRSRHNTAQTIRASLCLTHSCWKYVSPHREMGFTYSGLGLLV